MVFIHRFILLLLSISFFHHFSHAQGAPEPVVEWEKRQGAEQRLTAFGDDLFGDQIDPNTGTISFVQTDVSIPGNSGLAVALTRRRTQGRLYKTYTNAEFGDWEYVVPRLKVLTAHTNTWSGNRCSTSYATQFPAIAHDSNLYYSHQYSNGISVEVGGSSDQLLESPQGGHWPTAASHVTKGNWYFTCINNGQNFMGHAPDGTTYHFDKLITHGGDPMSLANAASMGRTQNVLAATEVADPHGNWVRYDYDTIGRLTRIHSNDGREITLGYTGSSKLVQSVSANGRTWQYVYRASTYDLEAWQNELGDPGDGQVLGTVTRPDGKQWGFTLDQMTHEPGPSHSCVSDRQISATHPNGATANFTLSQTAQRQSINDSVSMQSICPAAFDPQDPNPFPNPLQFSDPSPAAAIVSVKEKTISGPSIATATWTYEYEGDEELADPDGDRTNWTKVTGPGIHLTYFHKWVREPNGGSLVRVETRETENGSILQSVDSTFTMEDQLGIPASSSGLSPPFRNRNILTTQNKTTRDGDTYTTDYTYNSNFGSSDYSFGSPVSVDTSTSTVTQQRTSNTSYIHLSAPWIVGLPSVVTRNGKEFDRHTYDANGKRLTTKKFGYLQATYTYHTDGTLASLKNALNYTTYFANYKRGTPQAITLRDGNTIGYIVDNDGRVTSETNPNGTTFGYSYDDRGWITNIDQPGTFADTNISYALSANGVVQTSTRGTLRETVTYDNMLRPTLVASEDLTGNTAYTTYTKSTYDPLGRAIFTSQPSTMPSPSQGVDTSYDALGRVTQTQETISPYANTTTEYLSGNKIKVIDPVGAQTITTNRAFGSPSTDEVMQVVDATGTTTSMTRDIYGNIRTLNQSSGLNGYTVNVTREFWYDSRLRLCRHRAPEFGDEMFRYDNANRLLMTWRGASPAPTCAGTQPGERVVYYYDAMDRVTRLDYRLFPYDIFNTYDANGNVLTTNRLGANWTYSYNELDQVTSEALLIDGRNYLVHHNYDLSGNLQGMLYPNGSVANFYPDGFGRPTQVQDAASGTNYVSNIDYHVSGQVSTASYANGQGLVQSLNARQLPLNIKVSGAGTAMNLFHYYDDRGKVTSIIDNKYAGQDRTFTYDLRGRLETATGPWGLATYDFDGLDNARAKTIGTRTVDIAYDSIKNLPIQAIDSDASGPWAYTHDAHGNVTSNGRVTIGYDFADQPVSMSGPGINATYLYDGNKKRVKATTNGETTYWVYSKVTGTPVYQDNITTGETQQYLSGGGATIRVDQTGEATYTHLDHLGSPVAATKDTGALKWREFYTPFGEKWLNPSSNKDDLGYTGHVQDDASGLTYMQARFYDPVTMRFLSTDPIGYRDQLNLYAYVTNDPINNIDPTGEACVPCVVWGGYRVYKLAKGINRARKVYQAAKKAERVASIASSAVETASNITTINEAAGPFDVNPDTGKVKDTKLPGAREIGGYSDEGIDAGLEQLDHSIDVREQENADKGKGDPNSNDPKEREKSNQYKRHEERISREKETRELLKSEKSFRKAMKK